MAIYPQRPPFPLSQAGVGGGTPATAVALDPQGLVPVNRAQPVATDGLEPQRLMERRLGSMPPSSFSGAGGGFVPIDRIDPPNPDNGAMGRMGAPASISGQAAARIATAQSLGAPGSTGIPNAMGNVTNPRALQALQAAQARQRPLPTAKVPLGRRPLDRRAMLDQLLARRRTGLLSGR